MEQQGKGTMEQQGTEPTKSPIALVPEELLLQIFSHLPPPSLTSSSLVCKAWRRILNDDTSWRRAFEQTFTTQPYERLTPTRMPATNSAPSSSWVQPALRSHAWSWRFEYNSRLDLTRQWRSAGGVEQRRIEYNARVGPVDKLIVDERYGWALAVSRSGAAATRSLPRTGKLFARDSETKDIVFALPRQGEEGYTRVQPRVSCVGTRGDRIVWGFDDGTVSVTHLSKFGGLEGRVLHRELHARAVLDVAAPLDRFAHGHGWRAQFERTDEVVASSGGDGVVRVWSEDGVQAVLAGIARLPIVRVAWALGEAYVVGATALGVVFVWARGKEAEAPAWQSAGKRVPWLHVDPQDYADGQIPPTHAFAIPGAEENRAQVHRVVQLAGDPYSGSFVVATERGVWRLSVDGSVLAEFATNIDPGLYADPPFITHVKWRVECPGRRVAGFSKAPSAKLNRADGEAQSDKGKEASASVIRLDLSKATRHEQPAGGEVRTRVLLVGDASGSLTVFDGDGEGAVQPTAAFPRIHKHAISALDANASIIVSASRDGRVLVIEPLSGELLRVLRCRGGGRGDRRNRHRRAHEEGEPFAPRRLDPWFWSVHPAVVTQDTRADVYLAQLLAGRTADQWGDQVADAGIDLLDRSRDAEVAGFYRRSRVEPDAEFGFPTLVSDVACGYGWVVIANGTRVQSAFTGHRVAQGPQASTPKRNGGGQATVDMEGREIEEILEELKAESESIRERRIADSERRRYVEREFTGPAEELGLGQGEQLKYALWLSAQQAAEAGGSADRSGSDGGDEPLAVGDMTEEEQMQYALRLSEQQRAEAGGSADRSGSDGGGGGGSAADRGSEPRDEPLAVGDMTEEEQMQYALRLSERQRAEAGGSGGGGSAADRGSEPRDEPFVIGDMTEEEQLQYAMFLSRTGA